MKFLVWFVRFLPHNVALAFGRFLGWVVWLLLWKKTDTAEARCVKALGVGVTIARQIVRGSFVNFGMSVVEFVRLQKIAPVVQDLVTLDKHSRKVLDEALSRKKGLIFLIAHMDNWELMAVFMNSIGYKLSCIYTPQRDQKINEFIDGTRSQVAHMDLIPSEGAGLREVIRLLKSGGILVNMQDLDARGDGVPTTFLGLPARTHDGTVKLHHKLQTPVIPARYYRDKKNPAHHVLIMPEILSDKLDKNGRPFGEDMAASLEMCNSVIEGWIRETPDQWLWLLDRWQYTLGKI